MNPIQLSCHEGTRSLVKALQLSVVLLLTLNFNLSAQDLPPIPGGGDPGTPREPTPEELEAQRLVQEAYWQANRERLAPFLHNAPAPEPEDLALKQRLISAELQEREWKQEALKQRDEKLRAWVAEVGEQQRAARDHAKVLARRLGIPLADENPEGYHVDFQDGQLVALMPMNVNAQKSIGVWKAKTNAPVDYPLNVNAGLVGMWELSVPGTNHLEFNEGSYSRLIYLDTSTNVTYRDHATAMAGTIAAAGLDSAAEGMANSATVVAFQEEGDTTDMATAALNYGLRLSNHSYGATLGWAGTTWMPGTTNYYDLRFASYGSKAQSLDSLGYLHQEYLSVWPTGNDRDNTSYSGQNHFHFGAGTNLFDCTHAADDYPYDGYLTLTPESTAKNIIAVSSIHDLTNGWQSAGGVTESGFSNRGPSRDGRMRPDISANGQTVYSAGTDGSGSDTYGTASGTSSAAASVAGAAALTRERLIQTGITAPSAALVKAVLMGTAKEAGTVGPDYIHGAGVLDADHAVNLILTNKYFFNTGGGLLKSCLFEGVLTNSTYQDFTVYKNVGEQLKVMLVWPDPPGSYGITGSTNLMLVNDLDIEILHGGFTNLSYALDPANRTLAATQTGNFRDNAEMNVWTNTAASGLFTIRVKHKGTLVNAASQGVTTNQPFAFAVTGNILQELPQIVDIAQTASNQVTVTFSGVLFQSYKLQSIDEVDAPANAWSDATGTIYMTNNPAAVALTMPTNAPNRFYRVIRP